MSDHLALFVSVRGNKAMIKQSSLDCFIVVWHPFEIFENDEIIVLVIRILFDEFEISYVDVSVISTFHILFFFFSSANLLNNYRIIVVDVSSFMSEKSTVCVIIVCKIYKRGKWNTL